jgi:RNA polymerase sigma-70 factor (ECF subfamily)
MDDKELDQRLSRISTTWSLLLQAHHDSPGTAATAQRKLMERYCGAVYRYLLAAVRDPHAAEDLTQEFALRFVRGLFRQADPARGRFRDYVKTALFHLVDDYRRQQVRIQRAVPLELKEAPASEPDLPDSEQAFAESWRAELLARTWRALASDQDRTGQPYYVVLRLRVDQPELSSSQMAELLSVQLGKAMTAAGARQVLHRAREKFAELLFQETAVSLGTSGLDQVQEELAELNLLKYCRPILDRRAREAGA